MVFLPWKESRGHMHVVNVDTCPIPREIVTVVTSRAFLINIIFFIFF